MATECQIYFKIDRAQAINDINKLSKFHKNLTTDANYSVNKKCKLLT